MKKLMFILLSLAMLFTIGCQKDAVNSNEKLAMTDADLILAIQTATNKEAISIDQLPAASKNVLVQFYTASYTEDAQKAPELGYEVNIRKYQGGRTGERSQAYFDLQGRELLSDKKVGEKNGREKEECFEFVFPVTFIMPDGSAITVENKDGYAQIKDWYMANPTVREKPAVQFPVDIIFEDGTILTVNNDEELRAAYAHCEDLTGEEIYFRFIYPLTFIMPDGSTVTFNSEEELGAARIDWHANGIEPTMQFPVNIILDDGTIITVNSEEELGQIIGGRGGR